ncbi:hypothetical protein D623_10009976 [Myotis brandtii]|uniref:Uncharacterized protein n=1 Tax=Myotis brandtii TaxID=109478 RepID=S7PWW8_MYOBR|nr:hypothetical protein D623_10009976 [Myotis brandtii]
MFQKMMVETVKMVVVDIEVEVLVIVQMVSIDRHKNQEMQLRRKQMSNGDLRTQSYGGDGTGLLGVQEGAGGAVSTGQLAMGNTGR